MDNNRDEPKDERHDGHGRHAGHPGSVQGEIVASLGRDLWLWERAWQVGRVDTVSNDKHTRRIHVAQTEQNI